MIGPRAQRSSFEVLVRHLAADCALSARVTWCMLRACLALWTEYQQLHQLIVPIVGRDKVCRRFCLPPATPALSG